MSNQQPPNDPWQQQPFSQEPNTYYPQQPPYQPPMQPPLPQQPKKKPGSIFWIITVIVGLMVCVLIGSAFASRSTDNSSIATPTIVPDIGATNVADSQATQDALTPYAYIGTPVPTSSSVQSTPVQSDTYSNGDYKVGKTAQVGLMTVTVNSVRTSNGGEFDTPKAGNIYLIVDATIQNGSGNPQLISSGANFNLNDSTGQGYNETIISGAKPPDDMALRDRGKLRGQLVYEVPKTMKQFTFTYEAELISTDQATWDITI